MNHRTASSSRTDPQSRWIDSLTDDQVLDIISPADVRREQRKTEAPPRFRLVSDRELLATPPVEWLIDSLLPEGGLAVLVGKPGSGKSFVALDWAAAIARGAAWQGHGVRRGVVIYVAADGGTGVSQRLAAHREAHETGRTEDLFFLLQAINMLEHGEVVQFVRDVESHLAKARLVEEYPALVIVDTLARSMPGGDENSTMDMNKLVANADFIREQMHVCVLFLHHPGKNGPSERGSSALRGAADAMFVLKNDHGVLSLETTKQRDSAPAGPIRLRLVPLGGSLVVQSDEGQPSRRGLSPTARTLLETLRDLEGDGGVAATTWISAWGRPARSAYRAIRDELMPGLYVSHEGKQYRLTVLGRDAAMSTANSGRRGERTS